MVRESEGEASGAVRAYYLSPNSTWIVTSRLDTTRHVRRVERVEASVSSSTQAECMYSTRRTRRVMSRRDEPSGIWALFTDKTARFTYITPQAALALCVTQRAGVQPRPQTRRALAYSHLDIVLLVCKFLRLFYSFYFVVL